MNNIGIEEARAAVTVTRTIRQCARCNTDHELVTFRKLQQPSDEWTHWASCPKTGEPIMMMFREVPEPSQ